MIPENTNNLSNSQLRCGIVLAAGDGRRMQDFVYRQRGDWLPKQYINFIGKRSMLEHTFHRAEKLIPPERLFVIIAKQHLSFPDVHRQIASRQPSMVVTQPQNKDTAPGLLLPLLHVYKRFPEAPVAVFPSDHFILEEDVFIQHVDRAFRLVESDRSRIALLGIEPTDPDPEYGYIVPGETVDDPEHHGARKVEMFVEKPSREAAKKIIRRDALVNTLVVVFSCNTLMDAIKHTVPELHRSFQSILEAIGTAEEDRVIDKVYQKLPSVNFCKDVVENLSVERRQALVVLPVQGVTWSDWGVSERLSSILRQLRDSDHLQPKPAISPPSKLSPRKNVLVMPPKRIQ